MNGANDSHSEMRRRCKKSLQGKQIKVMVEASNPSQRSDEELVVILYLIDKLAKL